MKLRGSSVIPTMRYRDAEAAIDWFCEAFGFRRKMVISGGDGIVAHAELTHGSGMIMLGNAETEFAKIVAPPSPPQRLNTQGIYVVVEDADAHYAHAKEKGAEIIREPTTQSYGRDYSCRDPEGHVWTFGDYDPWAQEPAV